MSEEDKNYPGLCDACKEYRPVLFCLDCVLTAGDLRGLISLYTKVLEDKGKK
jgi:hypothetical protein